MFKIDFDIEIFGAVQCPQFHEYLSKMIIYSSSTFTYADTNGFIWQIQKTFVTKHQSIIK